VPNQTVKPNSASSQEPKARKVVTGLKAIAAEALPPDVREHLVALAITKYRLPRLRRAVKSWSDRVEAKMPGASRFVDDDEFMKYVFEASDRYTAVIARRRVRARRAH